MRAAILTVMLVIKYTSQLSALAWQSTHGLEYNHFVSSKTVILSHDLGMDIFFQTLAILSLSLNVTLSVLMVITSKVTSKKCIKSV